MRTMNEIAAALKAQGFDCIWGDGYLVGSNTTLSVEIDAVEVPVRDGWNLRISPAPFVGTVQPSEEWVETLGECYAKVSAAAGVIPFPVRGQSVDGGRAA